MLMVCCALLPAAIGAKSPPNLVLVTIDTLRADRLGCYGYRAAGTPNLDALAAESVRFKSVIAQVPLTLPSHCSILTGTYPMAHQVRDNVGYRLASEKATLAEILKTSGYRTGAVVGAYVLHSKFGLNQGFDDYDDVQIGKISGGIVNLNQLERRASDVIDRGIAWIKRDSKRPFFLWLHLYDPHDPYSPPAPFKSTYRNSLYDGEVAYCDQQIGRLLQYLKSAGLYKSSVIAVTSDHGESFGEHQEYTHGYFLYDTTLLVPLLIKPEGNRASPGVVDSQVRSVDIMPTLLQLLDLPVPTQVQGRGLLALMRSGKEKPREAYSETWYPAQFGWSPLRAVRLPDGKYIEAPKSEFYDLVRDPGETRNVFAANKNKVEAMRHWLAVLDGKTGGQPQSAGVISPEDRERLAALGYVGTAPARVPSAPAKGLPDPKDKLPVFNLVSRAGQAAAKGQCGTALPLLEKVLADEPGMEAAHLLVGRCLYNDEKFDPARSSFAKVLRSDPENLEALFFLAACDFFLDRKQDAEAGFKRVLQKDAGYLPAQKYLGFVYESRDQVAQALAAFQRAAEIAPEDEEVQLKLGFLFAKQSRLEEAITHFRVAVRINPKNAATHFNLGVAYTRTNQRELAQKELAEACRLDDKYCQPAPE